MTIPAGGAKNPWVFECPSRSRWAPTRWRRVALGFTVSDGKIAVIDALSDSEGIRRLDLTVLDD